MNKQQFESVLVVDDCETTRRVICKRLSEAGYEPTEISDGVEALDAILKDRPDYVITDWQMPNMNGELLCRCIRADSQEQYIYVIMMTAHSDMLDVVEGLGAGADDYITKPVDLRELVARLKAGARVLELDRRLTHKADHDPLTGMQNRRKLHDTISALTTLGTLRNRKVSAIMVDIDNFKEINDRHGHVLGDAVLVDVARALSQRFRASDFVCRYGGEEFAILLPNCDEDGAEQCAERCRADIESGYLASDIKPTRVTASFGVAVHEPGDEPIDLIHNADMALLAAKRGGRNRVIRYSSIEQSEPVPPPVAEASDSSQATKCT